MAKKKAKAPSEEDILVESLLNKRAQSVFLDLEIADLTRQLEARWKEVHKGVDGVVLGNRLVAKVKESDPKIRPTVGGQFTEKLRNALSKVLGAFSPYVEQKHTMNVKLIYQSLKTDGVLLDALNKLGLECVTDEKIVFEVI